MHCRVIVKRQLKVEVDGFDDTWYMIDNCLLRITLLCFYEMELKKNRKKMVVEFPRKLSSYHDFFISIFLSKVAWT